MTNDTIGEKLEAVYMLPDLAKKDYDLLEPCMNAYKLRDNIDHLTDKQKELIQVIYSKYYDN